MSGALLVAVGGNTNEMIPLFAIGVFTGFTLSQIGLVVHWRRTRSPGWRRRAFVNGGGAIVTGIATAIFLISKFAQGAWIVVIAVPAFVLMFKRINAYYTEVSRELGSGAVPPAPVKKKTLVIIPVTGVNLLTRAAVAEGLSLSPDVIAVSVAVDKDQDDVPSTPTLEEEWAQWNPGPPLRILHTEFSSVVEPIVAFIESERLAGDRQIVVLIPVLIPSKLRYRILHNQLDVVLSAVLRHDPDVVVARVSVALTSSITVVPSRSQP
jgi:hypothetical protein